MRSRPNILMVNRDYRVLALAKNGLSRHYDVSTARNALECADLMLAERFDLLIIDLTLPVVDGIELIQIIRRQPSFRRIPIIGLPASSEMLISLDGLDVHPMLPGPFSIDELHQTVAEVLKRPNGYGWVSPASDAQVAQSI